MSLTKVLTLLSQTMTVEPAPRLSIRRPNALLLKDSSSEVFVAFESKEERAEWMDTIKQVRVGQTLLFACYLPTVNHRVIVLVNGQLCCI